MSSDHRDGSTIRLPVHLNDPTSLFIAFIETWHDNTTTCTFSEGQNIFRTNLNRKC